MLKTNHSTLKHTAYSIQQSAKQGRDSTAQTVSRRTAATTRVRREGVGCQKQMAPNFCQQSDQLGPSIH